MHTETNNLGNVESVSWLRNMWLNMLKLKEDGVPIVGFTWYGLLDQVDWDTALREDMATSTRSGFMTLIGRFGRRAPPTKNSCSSGAKCCPWAAVASIPMV
jgi:hypothetical protein